jgi:hypothetical protein
VCGVVDVAADLVCVHALRAPTCARLGPWSVGCTCHLFTPSVRHPLSVSWQYDRRAYPFLVRLHCLRELEKCVSLAAQKSESAKLAMLQQWDWDGRLSAVMPSSRFG